MRAALKAKHSAECLGGVKAVRMGYWWAGSKDGKQADCLAVLWAN